LGWVCYPQGSVREKKIVISRKTVRPEVGGGKKKRESSATARGLKLIGDRQPPGTQGGGGGGNLKKGKGLWRRGLGGEGRRVLGENAVKRITKVGKKLNCIKVEYFGGGGKWLFWDGGRYRRAYNFESGGHDRKKRRKREKTGLKGKTRREQKKIFS